MDGVDAVLVPPGDPQALAAALRRVLADPDLALRLVDGGARIAEDATEAKMVRRFLALYEEILR